MAYDYYPPQYYSPVQPVIQRPQQQGSDIIWVQGENSAKAYPVLPGRSILLMDSENPVMYIKSTDQSGMPFLRVFDYTERTQNGKAPQTDVKQDYISREEFEKFRIELREEIRRSRRKEEPVKETKSV